MIVNKKGLSNIVATVLIILLAIAAVVIVWSFISNALRNTATEVDLSNTCFNTEVKPISCNTATGNVSVQLVRGNPESIAEILAVITNDDDTTDVERTPTGETFQLLGTETFTFAGGLDTTDRLQAGVIVKDPNNPDKTRSCDLSLDTIPCVAPSP